MRIAFYAPLKPPSHSTPSGDRRVARLLIEALKLAGHTLEIASRFRSLDADGDAGRQLGFKRRGAGLAERLIRRYRQAPADRRPDLWFTYHLYYKAPDWLGPAVANALGIPYVIAEASHAPKRAGGPWALGHEAVARAVGQAAAVFTLNPGDAECLAPLLAKETHQVSLDPFLDPAPFLAASAERPAHRAVLAQRFGLDPDSPWLVCVAMMRRGDKADSYRLLAKAIRRIAGRPWQLVVVGDGEARAEIERSFDEAAPGRVRFAGAVPEEALPAIYAACDLFVWPAVNEAFGMALLEAQAAGLPVVAGAGPGVARIIADGTTGRLVPVGAPERFADAVGGLLNDPKARTAMAAAARRKVNDRHGIETAAAKLDRALCALAVGTG